MVGAMESRCTRGRRPRWSMHFPMLCGLRAQGRVQWLQLEDSLVGPWVLALTERLLESRRESVERVLGARAGDYRGNQRTRGTRRGARGTRRATESKATSTGRTIWRQDRAHTRTHTCTRAL